MGRARTEYTNLVHDKTERPYSRSQSYKNLEVGHLAAEVDAHGDVVAAINDMNHNLGRQARP